MDTQPVSDRIAACLSGSDNLASCTRRGAKLRYTVKDQSLVELEKKNHCCMVCWLPCSGGFCWDYSVEFLERQTGICYTLSFIFLL